MEEFSLKIISDSWQSNETQITASVILETDYSKPHALFFPENYHFRQNHTKFRILFLLLYKGKKMLKKQVNVSYLLS